MPKVYHIGPKYFAQFIPYPIPLRKEVACIGWTTEIEEPYRVGKSLVVNLPGKKAFVLGWWEGAVSEEEALMQALMGRDMTEADMTAQVSENFARRAYVEEA